jgi:hypothetical protein
MPGLLFWLLLPMHVLLNLVEMGVAVFQGRGRVMLQVKKDAVRGLPRVWRSRKRIQSTRVASLWEIWAALNKQLFPIRR